MDQTDARAGFWAAFSAYTLWGLLPLYIQFVGFASPWEILAQRILWSIPFALTAVVAFRAWGETRHVIRDFNALRWLLLSAALIAINWTVYVWAVANAHVMEASLAYFITPLVQIAFGVAFFRERLNRWQAVSLGLCLLGVIVQGVAIGAPPWIALVLCATWSCYGLIRKQLPAPATGGLLIETLLLAPLAGAGLLFLSMTPAGLVFDDSAQNAVLLALAGVVTAAPLMLFAFGARRLRFATIGVLQFLSPSLQFLIGLASGEPFTLLRAISFAMIWAGLAVFAAQLLRPGVALGSEVR